jgi:hypothetical protein
MPAALPLSSQQVVINERKGSLFANIMAAGAPKTHRLGNNYHSRVLAGSHIDNGREGKREVAAEGFKCRCGGKIGKTQE